MDNIKKNLTLADRQVRVISREEFKRRALLVATAFSLFVLLVVLVFFKIKNAFTI